MNATRWNANANEIGIYCDDFHDGRHGGRHYRDHVSRRHRRLKMLTLEHHQNPH
jgi:hypothetical protein